MSSLIVSDEAKKEVKKLIDMFTSVASGWFAWCKYYVKTIDGNPEIKELLISECSIPKNTLKKAEQVGRGLLHHSLLFVNTEGHRHLAKCLMSEQEKYLKDGIDVLCVNNKDSAKIAVENLTKEQCAQVFSFGSVNDLEKQRANAESRKTQKAIYYENTEKQEYPAYTIKKDFIIVNRSNLTISKTELLAILGGMI